MKIRNGFVSNSSSSSFIVGFPVIPRSVEEVKQLLFKDEDYYPSPFHTDRIWPVETVAETVFNDMKKQVPMSEGRIFDITKGMAEVDYDDVRFTIIETDEDGNRIRKTDWDALAAENERLSKIEAENFLDKNPDCYFFAFEYADEDGDYNSDLEHGELFRRLPHIRISNH